MAHHYNSGFKKSKNSMLSYPQPFKELIAHLKKLPGVGARTAERYAFDLLGWDEKELESFTSRLDTLHTTITHCAVCNCLKSADKECDFCSDKKRNPKLLCIVASVKDVYSLEETRSYNGLYHVLGGLLSPLTGYTPEKLNLESLRERLQNKQEGDTIEEVIIAIDSTLEGDTTSLYIKELLQKWNIKASRLAFGIPIGSSLDFVDGGTLLRAFEGRLSF